MGGCTRVVAMEMAEVLGLCICYFSSTSPIAGCEAVRDTDLSRSSLGVWTQWFDGWKIYQQLWKLVARACSRDKIWSVVLEILSVIYPGMEAPCRHLNVQLWNSAGSGLERSKGWG